MSRKSLFEAVLVGVFSGMDQYGRSEIDRHIREAESDEDAEFWAGLRAHHDVERRLNEQYCDALERASEDDEYCDDDEEEDW